MSIENAAPLPIVLDVLVKSQQFTQEQINGFAELHMRVKNKPETIEIPKPQWWFYSKNTVTLGDKEVKVRFLSGWDVARLAPKIENFYTAVSDKKPAKNGAPGNFDPMQLAGAVLHQAMEERQQGKITGLVYAVWEELAILASADEEISVEYMFAVPLPHIKKFMKLLLEVNQEDFLELSGVKHKDLGSLITTMIGKTFSFIENLVNPKKKPQEADNSGSDGGAPSIGQTPFGTP